MAHSSCWCDNVVTELGRLDPVTPDGRDGALFMLVYQRGASA